MAWENRQVFRDAAMICLLPIVDALHAIGQDVPQPGGEGCISIQGSCRSIAGLRMFDVSRGTELDIPPTKDH